MEEKKYALLIDAENTSSKYIDAIIKELKTYGVITYQRMYGDFSNPALYDWSKKGLEHAIVPIEQPHYSSAKNAADIMLVIDAMDILYQENVDGFCIVTSDSDFTRLVSRIRENGKIVIGMGKSNASKTLIAACDEYKFLDKIADEEEKVEPRTKAKKETHDKADSITPLGDIKTAINNLIQQSENEGGQANLGSTKSTLQKLFPDFDERNYGYNSMRKFIEEETKFKTRQAGSTIYITRNTEHVAVAEDQVRQFVVSEAKNAVDLAVLGQMIIDRYPDFKYKDLGYARLSSYVKAIPSVKVENNIVRLREDM